MLVHSARCLAVVSDVLPEVSLHRSFLQLMVRAFLEHTTHPVQTELHKYRSQDDFILMRYTVPTACKVRIGNFSAKINFFKKQAIAVLALNGGPNEQVDAVARMVDDALRCPLTSTQLAVLSCSPRQLS